MCRLAWLLLLSIIACHSSPERKHFLAEVGENSKEIPAYSVVLFLSGDCPLCQSYRPFLKKFSDSIRTWKNWKLFLVYTNADTFESQNFIHATELNDAEKKLQKYFQATITPEVFVVDSSGQVLYRGAMDNYAYETGKHRPIATEHYLLDAVYAIRTGQKIEIQKTNAIGCYIE